MQILGESFGVDIRTPHGVRGLKLAELLAAEPTADRTPHGVRGLKFDDLPLSVAELLAPLTGCVD